MGSSRSKLLGFPGFPHLTPANHEVKSDETPGYNCIAWAAGDVRRWWWPDRAGFYYWPAGAPRVVTPDAFRDAYASVGFGPCKGPDPEDGYEKVAVYLLHAVPTHAARQVSADLWTSKIGSSYDIIHTLDALDGPLYGSAAFFLRRPLAQFLRLSGGLPSSP